jgi:micrococcal nuclease
VAPAVVATVGLATADRAVGVVTRVVDGDTIDVDITGRTERIRLLNIDTPETVDPDEAVQCLGPEATAFLAARLPLGTTVRLEYDVERTDRYGRTLAAVFAPDGGLVNADIARAGLGVAVVVGRNDRFHPPVLVAQQDAASWQVGLFSPSVACTVPGRVEAVSDAVAALPAAAVTMSSAELGGAADRAATVVKAADALRSAFDGVHVGIIWAAFPPHELARIAAGVTRQRGAAQVRESQLRGAEAAAATREAADRARVDSEQRARAEAEARPAVGVQRPAPKAALKPKPKPKPAPEPKRKPAPKAEPAPSANPYPGYTGPRCYAPGGKTWRPC